ncbi:MAG: hypothetical protein GWN71_10715, partial [Gammaproteobacteria bacterium]|nr:hypothetical protein [Gemmatimonadota bacterium]NIU74034.1 hypothetical protein [Gammaproteobacteria bacterium]NIX21227.1 hypothetical protein [Actinomycetota bacterium]
MLVYHHDEFQGYRPVPDGLPRPFSYHLLEADGDNALRRTAIEGGDRGVVGDIFALDGGPDAITDATTPSTRDHLGATTTLTVHSIEVADGVARIVLSTGTGMQVAERSVPDQATLFQPFVGTFTVAGGTPPY